MLVLPAHDDPWVFSTHCYTRGVVGTVYHERHIACRPITPIPRIPASMNVDESGPWSQLDWVRARSATLHEQHMTIRFSQSWGIRAFYQ